MLVHIKERDQKDEYFWDLLFGLSSELHYMLAHDVIGRHGILTVKVKILVITFIKNILEC